ncbi:MAG: threonine--tRNA ligase [Candidatus Pelagibacterales bacterium]
MCIINIFMDQTKLELIRHDAAHIMAMSVQELYPETKVTIGPIIENGFYYDFSRETSFTNKDLVKIEKKMKEIVNRDVPCTYKVVSKSEAIDVFTKIGENYKVEIINSLPENEEIKIYYHGEWFDLCKGPHLDSSKEIGKAFKLTKVAGAYWRGDSNNEMLQRIYGTAWETQEDLDDYLIRLEEAEKRDHRKLGKELDLFHFQEEAPGAVFWHPKGWILFQNLINYMRKRQDDAGYSEINTPDIMDKSLWELSGHLEKFGDNMFTTEAKEDRVYALKPMNCPGCVQVYKWGLKSYRDLPLRISEFGKVHRYEPSGALHGLMRVRAFTQDDAHIFCTEDQVIEESKIVCDLILSIYKDFGFEKISIKFSDRPEKRVGSDEIWDKSELALKKAVEASGLDYTYNPGEGAFYGPKLEFILRDAIGRDWQCGTLQVDLNMPERLGGNYIGEDGQKHHPVMLHRALFGSLERFTGILLEHYAGNLPMWLTPVQAVVAPITSDIDLYAKEIYDQLKLDGIRVNLDTRNEKISYKIRDNSMQKIPYMLIVGKQEQEDKSISIRQFGSKDQETIKLENLTDFFEKKCMMPNN